MNNLINKYIPEQFREVQINTRVGGAENVKNVLRKEGRRSPADVIHVEPIRGGHQGWSSHNSTFQAILPNDDRIIISWEMNKTLAQAAQAHISSKTGVVTLLSNIAGRSFENRTLSEVFDDRVHTNVTKYPFAPERIGDYAAVPGFQFKCTGRGITAINPSTDWRIKTNRVISMRVRKKLRAVADVVEGKAELINGLYTGGAHEQRQAIAKRAAELTGDGRFGSVMGYYQPVSSYFDKPRDVVCKPFPDSPKEGLVLRPKGDSILTSAINTIDGDLHHELLALMVAQSKASWWGAGHLLSMAPMFIAARGGYSLTEVEK